MSKVVRIICPPLARVLNRNEHHLRERLMGTDLSSAGWKAGKGRRKTETCWRKPMPSGHLASNRQARRAKAIVAAPD